MTRYMSALATCVSRPSGSFGEANVTRGGMLNVYC